MVNPSSISTLIAAWPTQRVLAADLGVSAEQVNKWLQRRSIPARWHYAILRAAQARGIPVSAEDLARWHAAPASGEAA